MNRPSSSVTASLVALAAAGLAVVPAVGQPTERISFGSCDDLNRVYPSGVAMNKKAAKRAVREGFSKPATSKRAEKVYRENQGGLDRDGDGVACEQTA